MSSINKEAALRYHSEGKRGKIEIVPTKPHATQEDLSLAYTPGVAEPCLEIQKNPADAYKYTGKGNLVAVISNGTAVLGLGNIGALAGKPVMEGKALLFKVFSGLDSFDIEVAETNVDKFVDAVKAIAPTFGGINLEDIKAPECFEIEHRLKEELDIPVMHDDQHGTSIITGAALLNALKRLAGIDDKVNLISPMVLAPIQHLKVEHLGNSNPRLHTDEVLIALSISAVTNPTAELAMEALASLRGSQVHSSVILSSVDEGMFKRLGMNVTFEPVYQSHTLYHK